ncbi:uncharacterized protein LOC144192936 [Stigmatopora nigra]
MQQNSLIVKVEWAFQALYNPSPSSTAETLQREEMEPVGAGAVGGNYGTTIGGHIVEGVDSTNPPSFQWTFRPISGPAYGNLPVTSVLPVMTKSYTWLAQLQPDQITSAVSLLELYCGLHSLPPPQYNFYSLPDQGGKLWLVYATQKTGDACPKYAAPAGPPFSCVSNGPFAINSTKDCLMTLEEIYEWFQNHFDFFRDGNKRRWQVVTVCVDEGS